MKLSQQENQTWKRVQMIVFALSSCFASASMAQISRAGSYNLFKTEFSKAIQPSKFTLQNSVGAYVLTNCSEVKSYVRREEGELQTVEEFTGRRAGSSVPLALITPIVYPKSRSDRFRSSFTTRLEVRFGVFDLPMENEADVFLYLIRNSLFLKPFERQDFGRFYSSLNTAEYSLTLDRCQSIGLDSGICKPWSRDEVGSTPSKFSSGSFLSVAGLQSTRLRISKKGELLFHIAMQETSGRLRWDFYCAGAQQYAGSRRMVDWSASTAGQYSGIEKFKASKLIRTEDFGLLYVQ